MRINQFDAGDALRFEMRYQKPGYQGHMRERDEAALKLADVIVLRDSTALNCATVGVSSVSRYQIQPSNPTSTPKLTTSQLLASMVILIYWYQFVRKSISELPTISNTKSRNSIPSYKAYFTRIPTQDNDPLDRNPSRGSVNFTIPEAGSSCADTSEHEHP